MSFYVYILASQRNGTLYVGMTDNLVKRIWMHKNEVLPGFTKDYGVKKLVWFEVHESGNRHSSTSVRSRNGIESGSLSSLKRQIRLGVIYMKRSRFEKELGPRFRGDERS